MRQELFRDKLYWQEIARSILSKRTKKEQEIAAEWILMLSPEDQKASTDLHNREVQEFTARMGFKVGSYVRDANGRAWEVTWASTCSGMLDIDDIDVTLRDDSLNWVNINNRGTNLNGLKEHNYFDNYIPLDNVELGTA